MEKMHQIIYHRKHIPKHLNVLQFILKDPKNLTI